MTSRTRREFLHDLAIGSAAAIATDRVQPLAAQPASAARPGDRGSASSCTRSAICSTPTTKARSQRSPPSDTRRSRPRPTTTCLRRPSGRCSIGSTSRCRAPTHRRGGPVRISRGNSKAFRSWGSNTRKLCGPRAALRPRIPGGRKSPPARRLFRRRLRACTQSVQRDGGVRTVSTARLAGLGQASRRPAQLGRRNRAAVRDEALGAQPHRRVREAHRQFPNDLRCPHRSS